jgi:hypothetical protein
MSMKTENNQTEIPTKPNKTTSPLTNQRVRLIVKKEIEIWWQNHQASLRVTIRDEVNKMYAEAKAKVNARKR